MKPTILLFLAAFALAVSAHDELPYTEIDAVCYWKAPPIEGETVIQSVKRPKWDHRGNRRTRWYICYNGILVSVGKTEADAWRYWVETDLIRRIDLMEKRSREINELTRGADVWQYRD